MIKDPVCNMTVSRNMLQQVFNTKIYYFYSQLCKTMFERESEKYVKVEEAETIEGKP